MTSLSYEQITQILADNAKDERAKEPDKKYPPPIQCGPLNFHHGIAEKCVNRGCGSPTMISVNGVRRCSVHALYELNRMLITATDSILDSRVNNCTCNAGRHSIGNVHTSDCATYIQISLDKSEAEVSEVESGDSSSSDNKLLGEL